MWDYSTKRNKRECMGKHLVKWLAQEAINVCSIGSKKKWEIGLLKWQREGRPKMARRPKPHMPGRSVFSAVKRRVVLRMHLPPQQCSAPSQLPQALKVTWWEQTNQSSAAHITHHFPSSDRAALQSAITQEARRLCPSTVTEHSQLHPLRWTRVQSWVLLPGSPQPLICTQCSKTHKARVHIFYLVRWAGITNPSHRWGNYVSARKSNTHSML